ncbi:MAG: transposase [Candidatus Rokubacteria bacterium]|nr:transposase [Candidatus Rokubacteria bacterium]
MPLARVPHHLERGLRHPHHGGHGDGVGAQHAARRVDGLAAPQVELALLEARARPPVAQDRLRLTGDGRVRLALKTPWADGTSHLLFEPLEFLEKLAALIPRSRVNLVLYHGVLAPHGAVTLCILSSNARNHEGV